MRRTPLRLYCVLITMLCPLSAVADVWHVDEDGPSDPGPGDALVSDPAEDGSADHPFDAIQEAIDVADMGDEIEVAAGFYQGAGNSTVNYLGKRVLIRGAGEYATTIQGDAKESCVVRFENGEHNYSVLQDLTIHDGRSSVCCVNTSPTLRRVGLLGAENTGVLSIGGDPQLVSVTIRFVASGRGASFTGGVPGVHFSTFESNQGGIECLDGALCEVHDTLFESNGTSEGGAILVVDSDLGVDNSVFFGNRATTGGAIHALNSNLAVRRCRFGNNDAYEAGGAIRLTGSAAIVSNSRFLENGHGKLAGALHAVGSEFEIANCLLTRNDASEVGGIAVEDGGGLIRNCTVAFNGGLASVRSTHADVRVRSSILWDEFLQPQAAIVEGNVDVAFSAVLGGFQGVGNIATDPKFQPVQSDFPLQLQHSSPCVNRGDQAYEAKFAETDLIDAARVQRCRVDMGAYETSAFSDCNANMLADSCEIKQGTQTDCNRNDIPDVCDVVTPPVVFADSIPEYPLDPTNWPSHNVEDVEIAGARLFPSAFLESRTFDLAGANQGLLKYKVFTRQDEFGWLNVEFWNGSGWVLARQDKTTGERIDAVRVVDLPRDALRTDARIRFRNPAEDFLYATWLVENVSVTRIDGDCDGDGELEVCAVVNGTADDCNGNSFPDTCDVGRLSFGARHAYNVGIGPQALAVGDFDNDGDPDVVVGRGFVPGLGTFRLLLNDGTGLFTVAEEFGSVYWPRAIAAADFDGNHAIDVATAMRWVKNLGGVWWGFANNSIVLPVNDIDLQPQCAAAGDIDGDGDVDLVSGHGGLSEGPAQIRVQLNDGTGSFTAGSDWFGDQSQGLRSIALADLDRDGDLDIAAAIQFALDDIVVLPNLGSTLAGTWLSLGDSIPFSATGTATSSQPFFVVAADFDANGWIDLAVANADSDDEAVEATVGILLNLGADGGGAWLGLAAPMDVPGGQGLFAVDAEDADGDGDVDLAIASAGTDTLRVVQNLGVGEGEWLGFGEALDVPCGSHPTAVRLVDLNADGARDLVVANRALNSNGSTIGTPSVAVFLQLLPGDTDCNADGVLDSCAAGAQDDCNSDGVFDACQSDCNANGIQDECDLANLVSADCNRNGAPDECDIDSGRSQDCDNDGVLDECVVFRNYVASSGFLTPLVGDGDVPQEFTLASPPIPEGDVVIEVIAEVAIDFTDSVLHVFLNDSPIGFVHGFGVCPRVDRGVAPYSATIVVPNWLFMALVQWGDATIRVVTDGAGYCFAEPRYSESYARVSVEYEVEGTNDCNRNHSPDGCDIAQGRSIDLYANGRPDECDGLGDADESGDVDYADAAALTYCLEGPMPNFGNVDCDAFDFNVDGRVDLQDVQGFQLVFGFTAP